MERQKVSRHYLMAQHRDIPVLLPGEKARRRYYLHSLAQYLINSLTHPGNGDAGGLFLARIVSGSHKRMRRHVRSANLHKAPVKGVSRVIRLHRVIAVPGARVNTTNVDSGRNFPAAAAFLGHHHHVFFQLNFLNIVQLKIQDFEAALHS